MKAPKFDLNSLVQWFEYDSYGEICGNGSGIVIAIKKTNSYSPHFRMKINVDQSYVYEVLASGTIRNYLEKDLYSKHE